MHYNIFNRQSNLSSLYTAMMGLSFPPRGALAERLRGLIIFVIHVL